MPPSCFQIAAAANIQPLKQGDYSNLCGLYSVINAIQLVLWPLRPSRSQLRSLVGAGIVQLSKRRKIASVMTLGMAEDVWLDLADEMVGRANDMFSGSLVLQPIFDDLAVSCNNHTKLTLKRALRKIQSAIANGQPVLCGLGGALGHYTVLSGYSEHRLTLFDSSRFSWLRPANVGVSEDAGTLHWLYMGSVRALIDDW